MTKHLSRLLRVALCAGAVTSAFAAGVNLDETHASVRAVIAVQGKVTGEFLRQLPTEILGTAVGLDARGNPALVVYLNNTSANLGAMRRAMPAAISGIPVVIEETEPFRAFGKGSSTGGGGGKPGGGTAVSHTAKQTPPIQLGTSGGWQLDSANGYCCGGTLGALISISGSQGNDGQYIMSNYHVFEADIVPGGNEIVASEGQAVIQPGLIDVACSPASAQAVGALKPLHSLPGSVDVSVAAVLPGEVRSDGAILEIGTISSQTTAAALRQAVKKSGRTTGLSRSTISGLNATVSVIYDGECAGGAVFTNTFTGQIVIANRGSKFLNSGDSGSLMVEDVKDDPRAVGLLYAGSSTSAIANPINDVLTFIGQTLGGTATLVGQ